MFKSLKQEHKMQQDYARIHQQHPSKGKVYNMNLRVYVERSNLVRLTTATSNPLG